MVKHLPTMREAQVQSLGWKSLWRRKWQPTLVFLPGKSHGQRSAVGYSAWGRKETDTTERLHFLFHCHNKLWKMLKEMGILDHLTCLLRNLYAGQEATVRTGHGQRTRSKLGKEYIKAVCCHPAYLIYKQSIS